MDSTAPISSPQLITGVVLAGGQSKRFGSNKMEANVGGVAMLHRVVATVKDVVPETYVSIGSPGQSADIVHATGCPVIQDEILGIGPIGGLLSAVRQLDFEWILLVAGDMPHLTASSLLSLISEITVAETDAVVAIDDRQKVQPLAGCYRSTILPNIERCVSERKFAMMALISTLQNVRHITFPSETLRNMNRLEDMGAGSLT